MAHQADEADRGAEREQGGEDREQGGERGAEHEQQHDQRQQNAEPGAREGLVVGVLGQLTGVGHGQVFIRGGPHRVDELLGFGVREVIGLLVERDLNEAHGSVRVDRLGVDEVARRVVGAGDGRHVGQLVDGVHHFVDAQADGGVGQAGVARGPEHDLLGVARVPGRHRLEQVDGLEGLRAREVEVVGVVGAGRLDQGDGTQQDDQPQQDDETAMTDTPPGQGAH